MDAETFYGLFGESVPSLPLTKAVKEQNEQDAQ